MPYITASIIMQLLTVVIPRFEQLKKEGQSGQNKLTQYTRYLTIALAILQSTGIVALADRGQLFGNCPAGDPRLQHLQLVDHRHRDDGRHFGDHGLASRSPSGASATACRC